MRALAGARIMSAFLVSYVSWWFPYQKRNLCALRASAVK
jgi:hypothetical protein